MDCDWPTDLNAALRALADDPGATLLSGGTDVMVEVNFGSASPAHVIALRRIEELRVWDGHFIGSGVTYDRLERGPIRALAQLARTVGSPQIRNAGTIGGNVATASPAGDSLPFIAAVDATIEIRSAAAGHRSVPWNEFITGVKRNSLRPGEIVTGVRLPDELPERHEFGKIGVRNAMVISMVSACVTRSSDNTTTVALGAVGTTPVRPTAAEELISNETDPSEAALVEFTRLVREAARPITDHRGTEEYRRHAAGVLSRRLLERCLRTTTGSTR